jgi:hypothetical protein
MSDEMARLFSYGTLQYKEVQLSTFGRELKGVADAIPGFALSRIEITDPAVIAASGEDHHLIMRRSDASDAAVEGVIFEITPTELAAADAYEVDDYVRIEVRSKSGVMTFVYVAADEA